MRSRQHALFSTIDSEGALLPLDVLQRIAQFDTSIEGLDAEDYHCGGEKLNEVINNAWSRVLHAWQTFGQAREKLPARAVVWAGGVKNARCAIAPRP